mmetsp:Transcript_20949/g.47282  ORF Transcript_20949/g.47282 Transcript_20949/m.47282 type:complete len:324 (-) Transcript_20949:784-1755(-)
MSFQYFIICMMLMISKAVTSPVSQYGAPDLGVGFGGGLEDEGWGIPPLLYKTGRYSNEAAFPHQLTVTFREIRSQNLNHRLVYVNDSQIRNVLSGHTAELGNDVVRLFESLRPGAYRADIGRFALLWAFGGIYSDLPQTFARPLDAIIPTSSNVSKTTDLPAHFFASDRPRPSELPDDRTLLFGIQTSFFAAPPGSPLLLVVLRGILDQIRAKDLGRNPLDVTGPAAVYRHVAGYLNLTGSDPETWGEIERTKIKVRIGLRHVKDEIGSRLVFINSGRTAVWSHGASKRSKFQKNALVYGSRTEAKRSHYDSLWKSRQVFQSR